jgi:hypothetical protein
MAAARGWDLPPRGGAWRASPALQPKSVPAPAARRIAATGLWARPQLRPAAVIQRAAGLGKDALRLLLGQLYARKWPATGKQEWLKGQLRALAGASATYDPQTDDVFIDEIVSETLGEEEPESTPTTTIDDASGDHAAKFIKTGVSKGGRGTKPSAANQVNVDLMLNGVSSPSVSGSESAALSDSTIESEMKVPSGSSDARVTNTQDDGEVAKLTSALKSLARHLGKTATAAKNQAIDVTLYGAWGACDGCKERIKRFAALWAGEAARVMASGTTSTLRISYQYLMPPTEITQSYGKNIYGWPGDETGNRDGPYFHTVKATVTVP